jgi:DNA-binding transcriptional LysR family regulator
VVQGVQVELPLKGGGVVAPAASPLAPQPGQQQRAQADASGRQGPRQRTATGPADFGGCEPSPRRQRRGFTAAAAAGLVFAGDVIGVIPLLADRFVIYWRIGWRWGQG